jgi:hypothetical protein
MSDSTNPNVELTGVSIEDTGRDDSGRRVLRVVTVREEIKRLQAKRAELGARAGVPSSLRELAARRELL